MVKKSEIENILKDYNWMINSIKIMRKSLEQAGEGLTAQYGIESSLPKPQGTNSDPIYREVVRRSKRWDKIRQYEEKVRVIQSRIHLVNDEREYEVLHWLLEGKSMRWIGLHMGLSNTHIHRIKNAIVDKFFKDINGSDVTNVTDVTNGTNGTKGTNLREEKSSC